MVNLISVEPNGGYPLFFCNRILCSNNGEWPSRINRKPLRFIIRHPHKHFDLAAGAWVSRIQGGMFRRRAKGSEARFLRPIRSIQRRHR